MKPETVKGWLDELLNLFFHHPASEARFFDI
jgi:hypothetical protein